MRATHGLSQQSIDRIRMKVGEGLTGLVAEQGTVKVASAQEHPNFRLFPDADEEQFKSFLGVPLRTRGSTIVSLLCNNVKHANSPTIRSSY